MKKILFHFCKLGNQKMSSSQVILLRHASSIFNQDCHIQAKKLKIENLSWQEQQKNQEFRKNVCFNKKYFDCGISSKGIKQCLQLSIKDIYPIDLILVSPLLRALETCNLIFKGQKVPTIVQPILAESCRYSCDVLNLNNLLQKKKKFSTFLFRNDCDQKYAYEIPKSVRSTCDLRLKSKRPEQIPDELMNMMQKRQLFQNDSELRRRSWKVKQMLENYSQQYSTICVVSHWYLLTTVLSKKFSNQDQNLEYPYVENCKPYRINLQELIRFK